MYFKSSPKDVFLLIFLEKGTGRVREKHHLVVSHMRPDWGLNPQSRYVP